MSKQGAIKVATSSIKPQIALATSPTSTTTTTPKQFEAPNLTQLHMQQQLQLQVLKLVTLQTK
jgi:hypothetical protein